MAEDEQTPPQPKRRIYFKFPFGWNEMTPGEQDLWASGVADALVDAAGGPEKAFDPAHIDSA